MVGKKNVELQKAETIDMFKNAETQKDDSKLKVKIQKIRVINQKSLFERDIQGYD